MIESTKQLQEYVVRSDPPLRDRRIRSCAAHLRAIGQVLLHGDLTDGAIEQLQGIIETAHRLSVVEHECAQEPLNTSRAETHPWVGQANMIAPPMEFHLEGEVLVGVVRCSELYSGLSTRVHGGVIAGLFDAVVATRGAFSGASTTAKLVVDYRHPVPVNEFLRLEADVDRFEGRKCYVSARMFHAQTLCAEATALMLPPREG